MKHKISAELKMVGSNELEKSVAKDLLVPDPTIFIPLGEEEVNENPKKHDRGTSDNNNFPDFLSPRE